jgi:hypothetical protein
MNLYNANAIFLVVKATLYSKFLVLKIYNLINKNRWLKNNNAII